MEYTVDQPSPNSNQKRKRCLPTSDSQTCKFQKLEQSCNEGVDHKDAEDGCTIAEHRKTTIDDLPSTVMIKILNYLSLHDLLVVAGLVCKQWHDLTRDPDLWRQIHLSCTSKVDDEVLGRLCSYSRNVTSLCAPYLKMVTGNGIKTTLGQCTNLKYLNITSSMDLESTAFEAIGDFCHNLVHVDLSCCFKMSDFALTKMGQHCNLLEHVVLSQCYSITDDGVKALALGCPRLKSLQMKHNLRVSDKAVEALGDNCTQLEELWLSRCDVTSACLKHIAKLSHLRTLEAASIGPVTPTDIEQVVKNCPRLSSLNLSLCQSVNDGCVDVIVKYAQQLSSLSLVSCNITDKSLLKLAKSCKTLERLDVGWCQEVTDIGAFEICRNCPKLKYLGIMRCDSVSSNGAIKLAKKFPNCTISTVWLDCLRLLEKAEKQSRT